MNAAAGGRVAILKPAAARRSRRMSLSLPNSKIGAANSLKAERGRRA
jgi:hypothetical protein